MPKLGLHLLSRARGLLLVTRTLNNTNVLSCCFVLILVELVAIRCTNPFPGTLKFVSEGKASLSQLKFGSSSGSAGSWGGGAGCACRARSSAIKPQFVESEHLGGLVSLVLAAAGLTVRGRWGKIEKFKCRPTLNCVILGSSITYI